MPRLFSNDSSDQQDAATASDSSSNLVLSSLDSFPQLKTVSEHAHYTTIYLFTFRSCRYMTKTRHHKKGHSEVLCQVVDGISFTGLASEEDMCSIVSNQRRSFGESILTPHQPLTADTRCAKHYLEAWQRLSIRLALTNFSLAKVVVLEVKWDHLLVCKLTWSVACRMQRWYRLHFSRSCQKIGDSSWDGCHSHLFGHCSGVIGPTQHTAINICLLGIPTLHLCHRCHSSRNKNVGRRWGKTSETTFKTVHRTMRRAYYCTSNLVKPQGLPVQLTHLHCLNVLEGMAHRKHFKWCRQGVCTGLWTVQQLLLLHPIPVIDSAYITHQGSNFCRNFSRLYVQARM